MRYMLFCLLGGLFLYSAIFLYILINESSLIYYPPKKEELVALEDTDLKDAKEIDLYTADKVQLKAWYRLPEHNKPIIVMFHGNAQGLSWRAPRLKALENRGYGFIIPAWRGFPNSTGIPSKDGFYEDARTVMKFLKNEGFKDNQILIHGESLGTGPASYIASLSDKYIGLFLLTPYTTIADAAVDKFPILLSPSLVAKVMKDNFSNVAYAKKINVPILIIHGDNDIVIPHRHTEELFYLIKNPMKQKIIYSGAGHTEFDPDDLAIQMTRFFKLDKF